MRGSFTGLAAACAAALVVACGGDDGGMSAPDAGVECVAAMDAAASGCPAGRVCLSGRCFARCLTNDECARTEICGASGVCELAPATDAGPPTDGGPRDAGTDALPSLCAEDAGCSGTMRPLCHPPTGFCVECTLDDDTRCGGGEPICDVGRGLCAAFETDVCAACTDDRDCESALPDAGSRCLSRTSPYERVCVLTCPAGTCPRGFDCREGSCVPRTISCTAYANARRGGGIECGDPRECTTVDEIGVVETTCPDGECVIPCAGNEDCPEGDQCNFGACELSPL